MINNTPNTGPTPQGQNVDPNILRNAFRNLLEDQGDYNNILKNVLSDLKKMDTAYGKIESRLQSLNQDSINIKQVNQELLKLRQKEFIENKKLTDLQKEYSQTSKDVLESARQQALADKEHYESQGIAFDFEKEMLYNLEQRGDLEATALYAAEKQLEYAKAKTKEGKAFLDTEKEVKRQLGISGNLMKIFADKIGVGDDAYAAMSLKARQLVEKQKDMSKGAMIFSKIIGGWKVAFAGLGSILKSGFTALFDPAIIVMGIGGAFKLAKAGLDGIGNAAGKTGEFMAGLSEHSGNVVRGLTSGVSNLVKQIPFVGGLLGGLIDGFSAVLDLILGIDNAIVKSGRQLNMSAESARGLYRALGQASRASGDVYMTGIKYLESQVELTKELGITNQLSSEILRTNIQLKDFAGLEADTRAKITESSLITGKSAEATTKAVLSQVVGLRRATGISFQYQQILKEASSLGGYLGLQFAKYPEKLTKSILSTKALGLELKSLDSKASGFLDFESSITKEFEAQLILGKDINLNKIRQAYLDNDLETAAAEIAKLSGDAAGYTKLNRIEQDTLAGTLEMSRDEMAEMLKQQELYSKFGVKNREDLLKQVDLLRQSGKAQEAINKAGGEAAYNDLVRASAQEKLALLIEKIKQSIVEFVEKSGLIEKVEKFINYLTNPDTIKGIIGTIRDSISTFIEVVGEILADVVEVGGEIANFFTFGEKGDRREREAYELGAKIRAGSLEMSRNIKANENYGTPVTVQENVVKEKVASQNNTKNTEKQPEQKPAPYGPVPNPAFNLYASFTLDDGINKANIRYGKGSLNDVQSGKSGTIVVANTD